MDNNAIFLPLPQFIEQVRARSGEPETPTLIAERIYYEVSIAYVVILLLLTRFVRLSDRVKDHLCTPYVTAMIMHVMQGKTDKLMQLLLHLPELKKLAMEAEIHLRGQDAIAMEIDQPGPGLGWGESTNALNMDDPVLSDDVVANVSDSTAALKEIVKMHQTNVVVDKRDGGADIRGRKARGKVTKGRLEFRLLSDSKQCTFWRFTGRGASQKMGRKFRETNARQWDDVGLGLNIFCSHALASRLARRGWMCCHIKFNL
ncbi:hypothetical protein BD410DRAFT_810484 [Rickenella mellea]|uniref:Uncharacterized protein n=1 Tax=Rickenella mellea TaxID=50990 RepID=A0A4Y7PER1_9AGAM|nr:hypothetical protein BD410DRAFT_810484 [Rickenella mellea]